MDPIEELLTRGVENIIPRKDKLRELLASGKKLNIYMGIDPTATNIHIGHAVGLRKLNAFAKLNHNVTFLIGDFTALIGDTSDKDSERPILTSDQIQKNFKSYKKQAEKVLDFSKVQVHFNSEWLDKLTFAEIIKLCQHFSAGDFLGRELIKKRLADGKKVGLHELLYPVMQGYDSYHMDTDIQLGGTDQTFNMQAGRVLQKDLRNKESFIIAGGFLEGTDGRKMSKSWGNAIWLTDEPNDMYGKVMSLKDELIIQYFTLATNASMDEVDEAQKRLTGGENPMSVKKQLARKLVSELHSEKAATQAQEEFETRFQKGKLDQAHLPEKSINEFPEPSSILDTLVMSGIAESHSAARRLVDQKAVKVNDTLITSTKESITHKPGDIIKAGRKAVKIIE